jgi:hypothetical protein
MNSRIALLFLLALAYTGLNALIPLQIDDAAYACYARQAASHPLDPYGFAILWYNLPDAANDVLAPPVLPYSVAPAVRLFGDRPVLWKLALLPWALLLAFAMHAHLRRFAPGLELELTAFLLFSPALLPSLNLMLDVPALALSLLSVFLFLRACDTGSVGRAVLAGLVSAVAMETKYTGVLAPGAMALATLVYRRPGLGLAAAVTAAHGFLAWELLVAILYGRSHFFNSLAANGTTLEDKYCLIPVFFSYLGGTGPAVVLLGLAATGVSGRRTVAAGAAALAAFAAVALIDTHYSVAGSLSPRLFGAVATAAMDFQLAEILFDVVAAVGVFALVRAIGQLRREPAGPGRADTRFLLAWLALEVVGYLVLTPFPATRRVLGEFVVLTFAFGRLAARTCLTPPRRRLVHFGVGFGIVLGLAYLAVDWLGARAHQRGAEEAAAFARANGGGRVWYAGHWGFQYYAEDCGMTPLVPWYRHRPRYLALPATSRLRRGDWLVVPELGLEVPELDLAPEPLQDAGQIVVDDPLPLRTVPCFYGGRTPLEHREEPRLVLRVYRVTGDCTIGLR